LLIELQEQADEVIVGCMRDAGFFYAVDRSGDRFRAGAFADDGTRTWVAANGFGVTSLFINSLLADEADEVVDDAAIANQEFVASLTAEQAVAYDAALVGQVVPEPSGEFVPAGCWADAYTDIVRIFSLVDEFGPKLELLNSRLVTDPRFQDFQRTWSACMEPRGYLFETEQALIDDIYARLLAIELIEVAGVTRVASQSDLSALQDFELEAGLASFECRQTFADKAVELRMDYELEFLDDNRFRLAEIFEPEQE